MPQFTVRYYDRNPLDQNERYTIHRETVTADSKREAGDIMAYCGMEVIGVDEVPTAEQQAKEARDIDKWLDVMTPEQVDFVAWVTETEQTRKSDYPAY